MSISIDRIEGIVRQLREREEKLSDDDILATTLAVVAFSYGFDSGREGGILEKSIAEFFVDLSGLSEQIGAKLRDE